MCTGLLFSTHPTRYTNGFRDHTSKVARNLRTIRTKLDTDRYESVDSWEVDTDLMIQNAIKFNGADSNVGQIVFALEARMHDLLVPLRVTTGVPPVNCSHICQFP